MGLIRYFLSEGSLLAPFHEPETATLVEPAVAEEGGQGKLPAKFGPVRVDSTEIVLGKVVTLEDQPIFIKDSHGMKIEYRPVPCLNAFAEPRPSRGKAGNFQSKVATTHPGLLTGTPADVLGSFGDP